MRLIDADILDNELWKLYLDGDNAESFRTIDEDTIIGKGQVSDLIAEQPTVQAVPLSVLQEIRQEIDNHCSDNRDRNDGLYIAMKIIDKYRTESEDNNGTQDK